MADENRLSEIAVVYGGMEKSGLYAVTAAAKNRVSDQDGKGTDLRNVKTDPCLLP